MIDHGLGDERAHDDVADVRIRRPVDIAQSQHRRHASSNQLGPFDFNVRRSRN